MRQRMDCIGSARGPVDEDDETQPVGHHDEGALELTSGARPNSLMGRARSDHGDDDGGASRDMGSFQPRVGEGMVTRLWFDRCSIRM